jgi:acetyl-CoA C-acetyltransferase
MRQRFRSRAKLRRKLSEWRNLTPRDLHGADVHDCFSITEIVAYEILGLAEPGKGRRAL